MKDASMKYNNTQAQIIRNIGSSWFELRTKWTWILKLDLNTEKNMLKMKFLGQWFKFWLKSHAYTNTAKSITYSHICRCKYMRKVKQWDCTFLRKHHMEGTIGVCQLRTNVSSGLTQILRCCSYWYEKHNPIS